MRRAIRKFQPDFSLRNLEADLNIIDELHLKKGHHVQAMAISLAETHWRVKVDAADVEYVFGTEPEHPSLKMAMVENLFSENRHSNRVVDF